VPLEAGCSLLTFVFRFITVIISRKREEWCKLHPVKNMPARLKIRWDGDVPGLAQHRLSLAEFGEPLSLLLHALRRIATQLVTNAVGAEQPRRGGRWAELARHLDIEITNLEEGSVGFSSVVTFEQPPQSELPFIMDLADRATDELLESLDKESKHVPRNWAVRKYLASLPSGVSNQVYELYPNGAQQPSKRVTIGHVELPDIPVDLPSLVEYEGIVIGVGFDPGRSEVRVKAESGSPAFDASEEQVNAALNTRNRKIRVLGVHDGRRARLLSLVQASTPRYKVTPDAIEEHIFKKWAGVFARLSKA
jgi:hypothetical protein